MTDKLVDLDSRRDILSRRSIEARRQLIEMKADRIALQEQQQELEQILLEVPTDPLPALVEKTYVLMQLIATMPEAQTPYWKQRIEDVLSAFGKLCDHEMEH